MQDKLDSARSLVGQGKYKKALQLLKKHQQKNPHPCYQSLVLEAQCLTHQASFQLGYLKFQQALQLTKATLEQKYCLEQMAANAKLMGKPEDALDCLKRSLQLDGSPESAGQRFALLQLAMAQNDTATVQEFAPPLLGLSQYHLTATLLLAQAASQSGDGQQALGYLQQLTRDIVAGTRFKASAVEIQQVINVCQQLLPESQAKALQQALTPSDANPATATLNPLNVNADKLASSVPNTAHQVEVLGNNPAAQSILTELVAELQHRGAELHPDLQLIVDGGNLSVRLKNASELAGQCMAIPFTAMPIASDYQFSVDKHLNLQMQPRTKMLNPSAVRVMQLLVALYNTCHKLKDWRDSYPLFALAGHKAVFQKLVSARSDQDKFQHYYADTQAELDNKVLLESFFASRVLGVAAQQISQWTGNPCDTEQRVFIPIAELTNHQTGAPRFQFNSHKRLFSSHYPAGPAGREVFAQYNLDDPVLSVLLYGFVDTSANWLYSIPLHFTSQSGLSISLANELQVADAAKLPAQLADLAEFLPGVVKRTDQHLYLSKLVIPDASRTDTLKRSIAASLKVVDIDGRFNDPAMLATEVRQIEQQIIKANLAYWRELSNLLSELTDSIAADTFEMLNSLCQFCITHIRAYKSQC
ncbi:hypothetical protein GCM10009092_14340 [Bowmanella denitrificans]|uniref:Uncharacterized protein n=1 Tax=Bowmanella denitrificans TaxID=366582 RepID=A0ABN0WZ86_9ALTE